MFNNEALQIMYTRANFCVTTGTNNKFKSIKAEGSFFECSYR